MRSDDVNPILEIRGLRKEFPVPGMRRRTVRALDGIDLALLPGEAVAFVGESACGKTTFARCAVRLLAPTAGEVLFDGCDLGSLSPAELRRKRREFQMIFQDPQGSLNPRQTVRQILSEPYEAHGLGSAAERDTWIGELLSLVALDRSLSSRRPAELSGGQQQRVVIARALALKPRLLIADEPVSSLDASVQAQILNLLADLRKSLRLTLVLISHSLPVVRYLCSRVVVMYLGRIVEDAPAAEFFARPSHPYSRALMTRVPLPARPGDGTPPLPGEIPSPLSPPGGCAFHPRCESAVERCARERPELLRTEKNRRVACFLYSDGTLSS